MGRRPTSKIYPVCFYRAQAGVGSLALDREECLGPLIPQASQWQPSSPRTTPFSKPLGWPLLGAGLDDDQGTQASWVLQPKDMGEAWMVLARVSHGRTGQKLTTSGPSFPCKEHGLPECAGFVEKPREEHSYHCHSYVRAFSLPLRLVVLSTIVWKG